MNTKKVGNILMVGLTAVASCAFGVEPLPDSAWVGTDIVFGNEHEGQTYELTSPATATSVSFDCPAKLIGSQVLTLDSLADVNGTGSLLVPLAGSNGLDVEASTTRTSNAFLLTEEQVIWENCTLKDGIQITAKLCGGNVNNGKASDATMFYFVKNGNVATAQFQCKDGNTGSVRTKVIKVQFEQRGNDVVAKICWAKYGYEQYYGYDFENDAYKLNNYNPPYATTINENGRIGITDLSYAKSGDIELEGHFPSGSVVLNAGRVDLYPQSDATIENELSGSATNLSVNGSALRQTFDLGTGFLTTDRIKVADDAQLRSVRVESAIMSGGWINTRDCMDPSRYGLFRYEMANNVDYYIQYLDTDSSSPAGYTKVVRIRFTSENGALYVQGCGRCARKGNWLGYDSSIYAYTGGLASSPTAAGYGLHSLIVSAVTGVKTVTLSGSNANSLANGLGVEVNGAGFSWTARKRLPNAFGLALTNGAVSTFSISGLSASQGATSNYSIDIVKDSTLALGNEWNVSEYAQVRIDGGLLAIPYSHSTDKDCHEYLERVTLRNKARITGYPFRVGYHSIASFLRSEGEGPNVVANGIVGVLLSGNTAEHVIDTATDLVVLGPLTDLSEKYKGLGWTKRGSATLTLAGTNGTAAGPVKIEDGTLALGDENVFTKSNPVMLAGGTLAVGAMTNNFGTVTLTADSSIQLGAGCVTFADSSAMTWTSGSKLTLIGSDKKLRPGCVRFSTDGNGLSSAQLAVICYNDDGEVQLDEDGWLISRKSGLIIELR